MPSAAQVALEPRAQLLDVAFALDALLVEQARDELVGLGLEKAEREILDLPLDLPDAEPVGQRREHLQRLARHALGHGPLAGRRVAQRLQARGQPQHHHAQVAREREQHLAHVLGLRAGAVAWRMRRGRARLLLHMHQLGGLDRQRGEVVAEHLGDHFLRPVQVLARIDQVAGGLHGLGARPSTPRWRRPRRHAPACSRRCRAFRRRSAARRTRVRAPACSPSPACARPWPPTADSRPRAVPTGKARAGWSVRASRCRTPE